MAGTRVRYSRESCALGEAGGPKGNAFAIPLERLTGAEKLLGLFVGFQVAEFAMLGASDRLDLPVAICLSASLVTVAGLLTRQRTEPAAEPSVASRNMPVELEAAPAGVIEPAIAAVDIAASPIGIGEESQPWADLMARISHEIRTPLNAVIGFSDLMGREIFGPLGNARYADYAMHIKESGDALLKSAEDTLALSSLLAVPDATQRPQTSDLNGLALDAWRFLEPTARRRGITLDLSIETPLDISGDRRAYRQVILNLMTEALNRAPDGSVITVHGCSQGDVAKLTVSAPQPASMRREAGPSLALCVARALLGRLACPLVTSERGGIWQAATVIDLAVQPDFFAQRAN